VREAFSPQGLSLWQSNGPAAHQEVPHFHMHVLPRFDGDGLLRVYAKRPATPPLSELERQAEMIRAKLR
jgi:histidine triad (HIT) family protein